ncbi:ABC transporter substrate-binding protein, partial [Klebsiella pneumoniae]|uniref:ABC transporter substrate-binding protein n=2 Tax=Pseudomonadota TaxID=1224 RepID=UPI001BCBC1CC
MKTMKHLRQLVLATACAASLLSAAAPALAQTNDQFIAIPSYRVGPYGTNGQSYYGGYVDYLNYVNLKEGGVNGVKLSWEECETEYNNAKGVECYERMKNKNTVTHGTAINPMATGISYALIDKTAEDKVPLVMIGYGRTDAVDGSVFPYAFPLVTTYQMQVSAIVKYLAGKNNGSLAGKKIVFLYHDSAYGKEPIVALQAESSIGKFKLVEIPVAHPGNEQGAQWLRIRQENPDYVIFWGWGVMNQTALKAAQK